MGVLYQWRQKTPSASAGSAAPRRPRSRRLCLAWGRCCSAAPRADRSMARPRKAAPSRHSGGSWSCARTWATRLGGALRWGKRRTCRQVRPEMPAFPRRPGLSGRRTASWAIRWRVPRGRCRGQAPHRAACRRFPRRSGCKPHVSRRRCAGGVMNRGHWCSSSWLAVSSVDDRDMVALTASTIDALRKPVCIFCNAAKDTGNPARKKAGTHGVTGLIRLAIRDGSPGFLKSARRYKGV